LAVTAHEKFGYVLAQQLLIIFTNPDNTVRGNAVADAQGNGFWLSCNSTRPVKQNKLRIRCGPQNMAHGVFRVQPAPNGNL
jgi:hypothetical protein